MNNRLKDKIVIITGGNGLIGKAIIERLVLEGAFCINFEINVESNDDLSNVYCDITDSDSINKALALVFSKYPKVDGLVNNAYPRTKDWGTKFEEIELNSWKQNVDWQLNSYFYITLHTYIVELERKWNFIGYGCRW